MLLRVENLHVNYGTHEVLHGVNLSAEEGEIVGIFGHNGAGKSTLLKAIFGLIQVKSGRILFDNEDKTHWKPSTSSRHGIGLTLQEGNIFPNLNVSENLRLAGYSWTDEAAVQKRIDDIFKLFPILAERKNKAARLLSGGERQMLALSLVLMTKPKLILLDEPSFGLAPLVVRDLFEVIRGINAEWGSSLLLVEQNVKEGLKLTSKVYVMKEGTFIFEGSGQEDERIVKAIWGIVDK